MLLSVKGKWKNIIDTILFSNGFVVWAIGIFFISLSLAASQTCKIMIPSHSKSNPIIQLDQCQVGGNLNVVAYHVTGRFVVDLHRLTTGIDIFDAKIREDYFKHRYAVFSIYPFNIGQKKFKALFRLNGIARLIEAEVLSVSKKHLDAYFTIDLNEFDYWQGFRFYSIKKKIDIQLRIFPNYEKSKK